MLGSTNFIGLEAVLAMSLYPFFNLLFSTDKQFTEKKRRARRVKSAAQSPRRERMRWRVDSVWML
jgi:hypothetical protein